MRDQGVVQLSVLAFAGSMLSLLLCLLMGVSISQQNVENARLREENKALNQYNSDKIGEGLKEIAKAMREKL